MAILLSGLQYIWIPKKDPLVITEAVIYISRSAHGRSVDGTRAVCHTICGLTPRPVWRHMLQVPSRPHSRGLAVFARFVPWIWLQLLPQGSRNVAHGMKEKQKVLFEFMMKTSCVPSPLNALFTSNNQTLFSLKKILFFSHCFSFFSLGNSE